MDKVRVQMAKIGPIYTRFPLPTVEAQLFRHCPKTLRVIAQILVSDPVPGCRRILLLPHGRDGEGT
jgi:hypothetical protein